MRSGTSVALGRTRGGGGSFFEVAIGLACGDFDIEGLYGWLAGNTAPAQNP
ncbi:hypothetical protein [Aminiphilus sp.]|uniref:hypothetical protein n=1 Tax=Aminiphilus sp. TaxID=1872488 RepID=UPI002613CEF0|nr:hypothetical protein [Aminiphilus sp.]